MPIPTSPVLLANAIRDKMPPEASVVAIGGNRTPTRIEIRHNAEMLTLTKNDDAVFGWSMDGHSNTALREHVGPILDEINA